MGSVVKRSGRLAISTGILVAATLGAGPLVGAVGSATSLLASDGVIHSEGVAPADNGVIHGYGAAPADNGVIHGN